LLYRLRVWCNIFYRLGLRYPFILVRPLSVVYFSRAALRHNSRECRSRGGTRSLVDMAAVMGPFGRRAGAKPCEMFF